MEYPPLRTFRWDANLNKKNKMFHKKMVCDNCYNELREHTFSIDAEGILKRKKEMRVW